MFGRLSLLARPAQQQLKRITTLPLQRQLHNLTGRIQPAPPQKPVAWQAPPASNWPQVAIASPKKYFHSCDDDKQQIYDYPEGHTFTDEEILLLLQKLSADMSGGGIFGVKGSKYENHFTQRYLQKNPIPKGKIRFLPNAVKDQIALAIAYIINGHNIATQEHSENQILIDQIFSTDGSKTFQSVARDDNTGQWKANRTVSFIPRFIHKHRQGEGDEKRKFLERSRSFQEKHLPLSATKCSRIIIQMENPMEFGDTRIIPTPDGELIVLAGLAEKRKVHKTDNIETMGRSTPEGHREFEKLLREYVNPKAKVYTIELRQPFYHMDTAGIPTPDGYFFTTREAFTQKSWKTLQEIFGDKLIEVPAKDIGDNFGGNGICFGNKVYVNNKISYIMIEALTSRGFDVTLTPTKNTIKGGGGQRCMTSVHEICPTTPLPKDFNYGIDPDKPGKVYKIWYDNKENKFYHSQRNPDNPNKWGKKVDVTEHAPDYWFRHINKTQETAIGL